MVDRRRQEVGQRGAEQEMVEVAGGAIDDPGPLLVVDHLPCAFENPAGTRVQHDQPRAPEVAVVGEARPGGALLGVLGERA
jgi:hypothetical protein